MLARNAAAQTEDQAGEYVAAPDLARSLRTIDPAARVDWDGEVFRITAGGQFFSLFLTGPASREFIVNGQTHQLPNPLVFRDNEFYIPSVAVDLMAKALEQARATPPPVLISDAGTTAIVGDATGTTQALPVATPVVLAFPTPPPIRVTPAPTPVIFSSTPSASTAPTPVGVVAVEGSAGRNRAASVPTSIRSNSLPMLIADRNQLREISARGPSLRVLSNKAKIADIQHVLLDADDAGLIGNPPPQRGQHMANATLEIARHVRNRLLAKGIKVTMTRENAERVPMAVRVSKARDTPADLLLTLSISEVESPEVSGLRAFYPSDVVDSVFSRTIDRSADEPLPASQVYRPFQARSQALASAMLQSVRPNLSQNATMGGGSAPAPLYLARRAPMPAINLVLGYMTNPADSARLSTPALQQELGYAIADALLELSGQGASGPSTTNTAPQDRTAGETPNE